jgi:hypothetical protein
MPTLTESGKLVIKRHKCWKLKARKRVGVNYRIVQSKKQNKGVNTRKVGCKHRTAECTRKDC